MTWLEPPTRSAATAQLPNSNLMILPPIRRNSSGICSKYTDNYSHQSREQPDLLIHLDFKTSHQECVNLADVRQLVSISQILKRGFARSHTHWAKNSPAPSSTVADQAWWFHLRTWLAANSATRQDRSMLETIAWSRWKVTRRTPLPAGKVLRI